MKSNKGTLRIFALVGLSLGILTLAVFHLRSRQAFDEAREMCSCVFLLDETPEFCATLHGRAVSEYSIDFGRRSINLGSKHSDFISSRHGCDESKP